MVLQKSSGLFAGIADQNGFYIVAVKVPVGTFWIYGEDARLPRMIECNFNVKFLKRAMSKLIKTHWNIGTMQISQIWLTINILNDKDKVTWYQLITALELKVQNQNSTLSS